MSVGSTGIIGSAAGTQLAQAKGTDVDKAAQETVAQSRQTKTEAKAESAAGIGETEQDEQASDRDADGRRLWELGPEEAKAKAEAEQAKRDALKSKDPSGQSGNQLDLSG